ncbi:hypothetical protein Dsin_031486 [Dipteronia sinensis]|uniref:Reverse transcriptase domain-containing protein n=1 Tax=Dipteronia sinensis TaxID=43782 RepID=A0AAD9ZMJ6_9ROSI|nr:hypothetical protein Dsin_031486 [Dipteronia sinensis]
MALREGLLLASFYNLRVDFAEIASPTVVSMLNETVPSLGASKFIVSDIKDLFLAVGICKSQAVPKPGNSLAHRLALLVFSSVTERLLLDSYFCSVCYSIGHSAASCHHAARFTGNVTIESKDKNPERGRSIIRQEYSPKHKSRDVPTSRVFETIKSGVDTIVTKPDEAATSPPNKIALDPAASSSSLRPIIPTEQREALKIAAYLDDSIDHLHTEKVDIVTMTDPVIAHLDPLIDPPMVEPHLHTLRGEVSSDTDSEGTESDFNHPTALDITCIQGGVSRADHLEDSGWKKVTAKKGIANSDTQRTLKDFCSGHRPNFVCIAEPLQAFDSSSPSFWRSMGLHFIGANARGTPSMWIFGSTAFQDATIVLSHSQHVTVSAIYCHRISFIYASVNYITRRSLWSSLMDIAGLDVPWLVLGDFNSVLGAHETISNVSTISCDDFRAALTVCDLVDIETKGVFHTLIGRGRSGMVLSRLDRAVCSHSFMAAWSHISCVTLPRSHSDHHPLLISCSASVSSNSRPIRFQGMWVSHPSFLNLVRSVWSSSIAGSGSGIVVQKLKLLKKALRRWIWEVFGDIALNVSNANEKVMLIQGRIGSEGFSDDLFCLETSALADLDSVLEQHEIFLKEKRGNKALSFIQIGENISCDPTKIGGHVSFFYQHLFSDPGIDNLDFSLIREHVPSLVTVDDNASILRVPSFDEVRSTVFAMDPLSAPGPDGFSGSFYSHCWEIVGHDVVLAVQDFFHTGLVFSGLNSNFLVLIPKTPNAILIDQFSSNCSWGRQIGDCIAGASECFNVLNNGSHGGHLALKIDIRKAFDSISWPFLFEVLRCFGFSESFIGWVAAIFDSARISVLINGSPHGYFPCSRGVRQGDPLSPLLFCLAKDFFSRYLTHLVDSGSLTSISSSIGMRAPSHFFYADDAILFCRASPQNLQVILYAFALYGSLSSQRVNWEKYFIFFGKGISGSRITNFLSMSRMRKGGVSMTYLWVPIFIGAPKCRWLIPWADKIKSKLESWKSFSHSMAVVMGSFLHSFQVYRWPSSLLKDLNDAIRNFFLDWFDRWSTKDSGGLGVKDLGLLNRAMLKKFTWRMLTEESFVFTISSSSLFHPGSQT